MFLLKLRTDVRQRPSRDVVVHEVDIGFLLHLAAALANVVQFRLHHPRPTIVARPDVALALLAYPTQTRLVGHSAVELTRRAALGDRNPVRVLCKRLSPHHHSPLYTCRRLHPSPYIHG